MPTSKTDDAINATNLSANHNKSLRSLARKKRKTLSLIEQSRASKHLLELLQRKSYFKNAKHIACYQSFDGELDLTPVIHSIWLNKQLCYLPVVNPNSQALRFYPFKQHSKLTTGKFNTNEPDINSLDDYGNTELSFPIEKLDVVLMPLVAFDKSGSRLGMGGGYYDFSFQHIKQPSACSTKLIGVAHKCQQVERIHREDWDIKPDEIIFV